MAFTQPQCGRNFPAHSWFLSQTYRWLWPCLPIKSLLAQWKSLCPCNSYWSRPRDSGNVQLPQRTHSDRANCSMDYLLPVPPSAKYLQLTDHVRQVCAQRKPGQWLQGRVRAGLVLVFRHVLPCSLECLWRCLPWSGCPWQLALLKREADLQRCTQALTSSSLAANLFKPYSWQNLDGACLMFSHLHILLLEQLGTYLSHFTNWVLKKTTLRNTFSQGDQHWVSALSLWFLPPQPPSSLPEGREQDQGMG